MTFAAGLRAFLTRGAGASPRIQTPRLLLRLPEAGDEQSWLALRARNADYLRPWEPRWPRGHLTRASFRHRLRWSHRESRLGRSHAFLIYIKRQEKLVGGLTMGHIKHEPACSCVIGYWMSEDMSGMGFMKEAVSATSMYGFDTLGLSRIEAACLPENAASLKVLRHCGFVQEGRARSYLEVNGARRDHLLFALLAPRLRNRSENCSKNQPGDDDAG